MSPILSKIERQVLELLDDHPEGLQKEQIIQHLEGNVTVWDLQELIVKGFLEVKEGRIRARGRFTPRE